VGGRRWRGGSWVTRGRTHSPSAGCKPEARVPAALSAVASSRQSAAGETRRQGELILQVDGWWRDNVRRRWADGKVQRMETLLDSIVTGFEVLLAARKANRLEDERRAREEAELTRRQRLAEERRNREKKRRGLLKDVMDKSAEAATLRQWLSSVDLTNTDGDEEFGQFISWAKAKLASLEAAVSRQTISDTVRSQELFPSIDKLHDPLGEPPRRHYYGMSSD
jgi:hypothetical protein